MRGGKNMEEVTKKVKVAILRSKPGTDEKQELKTYEVPLIGKSSILNVLNYISENLEPALGYYSSCRIGKCTGCAIVVNGKNRLACTTPVIGDLTLEPLKKFKIIKDLVVEDLKKKKQ
jgi:succinate dehydrogenase/fumarate reductase iron-sulfur protein